MDINTSKAACCFLAEKKNVYYAQSKVIMLANGSGEQKSRPLTPRGFQPGLQKHDQCPRLPLQPSMWFLGKMDLLDSCHSEDEQGRSTLTHIAGCWHLGRKMLEIAQRDSSTFLAQLSLCAVQLEEDAESVELGPSLKQKFPLILCKALNPSGLPAALHLLPLGMHWGVRQSVFLPHLRGAGRWWAACPWRMWFCPILNLSG